MPLVFKCAVSGYHDNDISINAPASHVIILDLLNVVGF